MDSSQAARLGEAWEAWRLLRGSLSELDEVLEDIDGLGDARVDSAGEELHMALASMASALCALEALALPQALRAGAPCLHEVLAYLASSRRGPGMVPEARALDIAASLAEYIESADHGRYSRDREAFPALKDTGYAPLMEAIAALLVHLEQAG